MIFETNMHCNLINNTYYIISNKYIYIRKSKKFKNTILKDDEKQRKIIYK